MILITDTIFKSRMFYAIKSKKDEFIKNTIVFIKLC
ncbi:hypothetical protein C8P70_103152 [Myroides indicus]|uniref:Uncharacterized protein n=1 Tax=Myroides indicus TaxID=1323422 RepID=A0A4R7F3W4_9FLAO|nr:hypothetical protein C8P70_103152 [Myroides indicus]